jgi:DNA-binding transcriptional LysR family regulator
MTMSSLARHLKTRELQYIVSVHAHGSIRKAAAEHNISQPALSKIIHQIESELGVCLFLRANNRTTITDFGRIFLSEATQILASVGAIQTKIDRLRAQGQNFYHVGATPNPALRLVPAAFIRTLKAFPQLNLQLTEDGSERLIVGLRERMYQLVIARAMSIDPLSPLKSTLLYPESGVIVSRRDHPLARKRSVKHADVQSYPWILPPPGPTLNAIEMSFINAGSVPPRPFFVNYAISIVSDILVRSDALTVLSRAVAGPLLRAGVLRTLAIGIEFRLPSYAVYSLPSSFPDPVHEFLEQSLVAVADSGGTREA